MRGLQAFKKWHMVSAIHYTTLYYTIGQDWCTGVFVGHGALLRNLQLRGPMPYKTPVHQSWPKLFLKFKETGRSDAFSHVFSKSGTEACFACFITHCHLYHMYFCVPWTPGSDFTGVVSPQGGNAQIWDTESLKKTIKCRFLGPFPDLIHLDRSLEDVCSKCPGNSIANGTWACGILHGLRALHSI